LEEAVAGGYKKLCIEELHAFSILKGLLR